MGEPFGAFWLHRRRSHRLGLDRGRNQESAAVGGEGHGIGNRTKTMRVASAAIAIRPGWQLASFGLGGAAGSFQMLVVVVTDMARCLTTFMLAIIRQCRPGELEGQEHQQEDGKTAVHGRGF